MLLLTHTKYFLYYSLVKNLYIKWRHDSPKNIILNKTENEDMVLPKYLYEQLLTKNFWLQQKPLLSLKMRILY